MISAITAVTEAGSQALVSLDDLKVQLGISDSDDDARLNAFILQASAAIAKYCGRVFAKATVTETFFLDDECSRLMLARYPLISVTSVTEDDTALSPLDSTTLLQHKDSGILHRLESGLPAPWAASKIVVVYEAGYDIEANGAPGDLVQACVGQIGNIRSTVTRDPLAKAIDIPGVRRTEYWVGSTGSTSGLHPSVEAMLDNYRDVRV